MTAPVIAHATDLSGDDEAAFLHACALAAASGARLITIHANPAGASAAQLPDAAPFAARWGRPIEQHRICHECCDDVADTLVDAIQRAAPTLVVAGTHAKHGLAALLGGSVAEAVARNVGVPTLIVPNGSRGFVDVATGAIDLGRVLVPAGSAGDVGAGLAAARALAALTGARGVGYEVLHVGAGPDIAIPPDARDVQLRTRRADHGLVATIVAEACAIEASVIVLPTRGHDGVGDTLLGSVTERVVRDAPCPTLSVPIAPEV
jgi:nucleotide-binding universal stress UspA family protein